MRDSFYGTFFKVGRLIYRFFTPRYSLKGKEDCGFPVIYVASHQNMRGPLSVMAWFDKPVHVLAYNVFCEKDDCYDHFCNYTFTERLGWPGWIASIASRIASNTVPKLLQSMRAIPVYRGSKQIIDTMQYCNKALLKGENLLIFPDIDYTDNSGVMGDMYRGFLHLERYYYKSTGKHIPFVPLSVNKNERVILTGDSIEFRHENDFNSEKEKVCRQLRQSINNPSVPVSTNKRKIKPGRHKYI